MFLIQWVGNIRLFPFQARAVELESWVHLHRLGEANVTDSSGDGSEGKKNENKEGWELRESLKLNKQLIRQNPCSGWLAILIPYSLMWHWKKYWDFSSASTVLFNSSPSAFGLESSGLLKEKLSTCCFLCRWKQDSVQSWKCRSTCEAGCSRASASTLSSCWLNGKEPHWEQFPRKNCY